MNSAQRRAGASPCPKSISAWEVLDDLLGPAPTVEPRQMFGLSCFAVAGKPFACVVDDAIALKLPRSVIEQLDDAAVSPFTHHEHQFPGWIRIDRHGSDGYVQDDVLIELALVTSSEAAAGVVRT